MGRGVPCYCPRVDRLQKIEYGEMVLFVHPFQNDFSRYSLE